MNIRIIRMETCLQNPAMVLIPSGAIQAVEIVYAAKSYDEGELCEPVL